ALRDLRQGRYPKSGRARGGSNRDSASIARRPEGRSKACGGRRTRQTHPHLTNACSLARIVIGRRHGIRVGGFSSALDADDLVLLVEVHDEMLADGCRHSLRDEVVIVVPPRLVERIGDHRRAEQRSHLHARHAGRDAIDVLRLQKITLLNRNPMDTTAQIGTTLSSSSKCTMKCWRMGVVTRFETK